MIDFEEYIAFEELAITELRKCMFDYSPSGTMTINEACAVAEGAFAGLRGFLWSLEMGKGKNDNSIQN